MSTYDFDKILSREIIFFHDFLVMVLIYILVFVLLMILRVVLNPYLNCSYQEGLQIETIWTVIPTLVLVFIFYPSINLLNMARSKGSDLFNNVIKIVGHQWYWEYRFMFGKESLNYSCYPVMELKDSKDFLRCLFTDNVLLLDRKSVKEINVSSEDVIHSFSLPSLGIKVDAIPGRIKNSFIEGRINQFAVLKGQCSEICGVLHSKMPIWVLMLPYGLFR